MNIDSVLPREWLKSKIHDDQIRNEMKIWLSNFKNVRSRKLITINNLMNLPDSLSKNQGYICRTMKPKEIWSSR
jgi:hypothetical protein